MSTFKPAGEFVKWLRENKELFTLENLGDDYKFDDAVNTELFDVKWVWNQLVDDEGISNVCYVDRMRNVCWGIGHIASPEELVQRHYNDPSMSDDELGRMIIECEGHIAEGRPLPEGMEDYERFTFTPQEILDQFLIDFEEMLERMYELYGRRFFQIWDDDISEPICNLYFDVGRDWFMGAPGMIPVRRALMNNDWTALADALEASQWYATCNEKRRTRIVSRIRSASPVDETLLEQR